jgi:hypothetical protein
MRRKIMVSQARIDANRRNAQKSTGPRSAEGKERVRFNALKHGVTAQTPVLPGEDPAQFHELVDAFTASLQPQNPLEYILVDRMALFTAQSSRAMRVESARAAANMLTAPDQARQARELQAHALGQRLFFDRRGPLAGYPNGRYDPSKGIRTSWSGTPEDPDDPARLVMLLESTGPGCRWLLDRWAELRARLMRGGHWQSPEKLKVIRLLGRQPLDAADVTEVTEIFLAAHDLGGPHYNPFFELRCELDKNDTIDAIRRQVNFEMSMEEAAEREERLKAGLSSGLDKELEDDEDLGGDWEAERKAEREVRLKADGLEQHCEDFNKEFWQYDERLRKRNLKAIRPKDAEAARAMLLALVDRAMDRLRPLEEANRIKEARLDALRADMAAFDDSTEGERVRRHAHASDRGIHRTLATFLKIRKVGLQPSAFAESSDQPSAVSGRQEGEGRPWSAHYGDVQADGFLQTEVNGRLHWDLPYEPGDVADADLQNKPNGHSYPGLQYGPNGLDQQLQIQPTGGNCGNLQDEPTNGDDDLKNEPTDGPYPDLQNEPPPPTADCLPSTEESGQQSAVSSQQEDESVPRSVDCADVRANGFLQNEANAGRDGDRENEANDLGEQLQSQPSDRTYANLQNEPNDPTLDLQIEPTDGDGGQPPVNEPLPPTAYCLPPTEDSGQQSAVSSQLERQNPDRSTDHPAPPTAYPKQPIPQAQIDRVLAAVSQGIHHLDPQLITGRASLAWPGPQPHERGRPPAPPPQFRAPKPSGGNARHRRDRRRRNKMI